MSTPPHPTRYVGIDVSKRCLDICPIPEEEIFFVSNDPQGIDELLRRLLQEARPELVVLEATDHYERLTSTAIAAVGIPVAVINPR